MAIASVTCEQCAAATEIPVADGTDGVVWECSACYHRNVYGTLPEIDVEPVHGVDAHIVDGDHGTSSAGEQ